MLDRNRHLDVIVELLGWNPIVGLLGPRQVGKTTLARRVLSRLAGPATTFDLENPTDLVALRDPLLSLSPLDGLVVIDEIQRLPALFPVLRVLVDRPSNSTRFLILGSASPDLVRQSSESLAGRVAYHELPGFEIDEVGTEALDTLWLRGGFPRSFLAASDAQSAQWRTQFVRTFLERDVPALGIRIPPPTLERFWAMLAHVHGELWNGAELARSFGISTATVRGYLDVLTSTFLMHQLQPWHANITKRQVKAPKLYFRDTGLLHNLLQIESRAQLLSHPKVGASWEGFALQAVTTQLRVPLDRCYFWRAHTGAELDLLVLARDRRLGFEFKLSSAPTTTKSMHTALADLDLERLDVIHAGERTFPMAERIRAVALSRLHQDLEPLS